MKGIAHFTAGVAVASCFPAAVQSGASGNPLYFVLGGVAGLMADTLDFKFYRFFYRHDAEITPDPLAPDATQIADALAEAVAQASRNGRPFRLRLNSIRLGPDEWQSYRVNFNLHEDEVRVELGPVVDTGGSPVSDAVAECPVGIAKLEVPVHLEYFADVRIDAFEGPLFRILPVSGGGVRLEFIPWHRSWSHSFFVGACCALVALMLWGRLAGAVVMGAYSSHILLDQLGYLGSNLFWPFSRSRTPGLKMQHSGNAFANFYAVWLSLSLIFLNLARYASLPDEGGLLSFRLVFWSALLLPPVWALLRHLPK